MTRPVEKSHTHVEGVRIRSCWRTGCAPARPVAVRGGRVAGPLSLSRVSAGAR